MYNGRIVRIANSEVFKGNVYNYNSDFPFLWDEITFPVGYGSDIALAKTLMTEATNEVVGHYSQESKAAWSVVLKRYLIENARTEPLITLKADENWVTFTIRYTTHYQKRRITSNDIYWEILKRIDNTKGEVKVASSAMDITAIPDVNVKSALLI